MATSSGKILVGIVMGSKSDWETMQAAAKILDEFGVAYDAKVASAHRSPELVTEFIKSVESRGGEVMIAAAGLAAHLPGVVAAQTLLPVLGVPMQGGALSGFDALLSIVQMPGGVPVGTLSIGGHGAKNSALLAIRILSNSRPELREKLRQYHVKMAESVKNDAIS
jgi:5-(carboxyamino)imidazole ribonucleotide mutase